MSESTPIFDDLMAETFAAQLADLPEMEADR